MKISTAEVTQVSISDDKLTFRAKINTMSEDVDYPIRYTSPFFGGGGSGFIGLPSVGNHILVVQPENTTDFFYLGSYLEQPETLVDNPNKIKEDEKPLVDQVEPNIYKANSVPEKVVLKDQLGNKLVFGHGISKEYKDIGINLKSASGKRLALNDSPDVDSIYLQNEHGDGVTISSSNNAIDCMGTVKSFASMNQELRAQEGSIVIALGDGKDISIVNSSTKINKELIDVAGQRAGNVNIEAQNGNVNIYSRCQDNQAPGTPGSPGTSKIHLLCDSLINPTAPQVIQIETKSPNSTIAIISGGTVLIKGKTEINLEAEGNIHLKSTQGRIMLQSAAGIDMLSTGPINIDGQTIDLNSLKASPVVSIQETLTTVPALPDYPLGVTT